MVIFWVFTVCGGVTRSMVIFQKLFSQCMLPDKTQSSKGFARTDLSLSLARYTRGKWLSKYLYYR